jgi:dynein heavy chain 1
VKAAANLAQKREEIKVRKVKVDEDLGKAEPALIAAQQSVSGIKKEHLTEMINYKNPPVNVALALEPVVCLLSKKASKPDWLTIKTNWLKNANFVSMIMNFNKDDIPTNVKTYIMNNYLKDEKTFDAEKIMKASRAAGPLALWVKSIITYSDIYHSITPLREELAQLGKEEMELTETAKELDDKIVELE